MGSALLVAVAVGLYPTLDAALDATLDLTTVIEPDASNVRAYDELYERYMKLHNRVEDLF